MIRTKFQEIIGTKYPIIQAGMGPYATTKLCIAVAIEGGLGLISTIGMAGPDVNFIPEEDRKLDFGVGGTPKNVLKQTIKYVHEKLQDYPDAVFGVNIPIAKEFYMVSRQFMIAVKEVFEEMPEVKKKLRVMVTSAGDPLPWTIDAKEKGSKSSYYEVKKELPSIIWCQVCPNVRGAKRAERSGVDIIIASGREGGAHCAWRDTSSMVLLPEVVRTVNLPVVGAGGFADGASLAAALALGAIGIQMGTRFIATVEGDFEQMWKEQLVKATEFDTIVGRGIFGPMRFLINPASLEVVDETIIGASDLYRGKPCPTTDKIRDLEDKGFKKLVDEDENESLMNAGVVTGRIHSIPTVHDLIQSVMTEAEEIILGMPDNLIKKENPIIE
ncbi:MAG: NAD(P)H-dependent flavin oxidoreductase [Candidatus Hodarchaeales archaeon]|jgi:enoyl-[acyl-carrier protein] reductase II